MVVVALPLAKSINVLHVELMNLRFVLQLSISYGLSLAMIYSDAQMAIHLVSLPSLPAYELRVVVLDILELCKQMGSCSFHYMP